MEMAIGMAMAIGMEMAIGMVMAIGMAMVIVKPCIKCYVYHASLFRVVGLRI